MNRRSFFMFACGGVAAAPMALLGEKANAMPASSGNREGLPAATNTLTIKVDSDRVADIVREHIEKAYRNAFWDERV